MPHRRRASAWEEACGLRRPGGATQCRLTRLGCFSPQGYVKATVTVLGPGDKPPSHESTQVQRDDEGGDLILRPPTVSRRGYNLNIKIYRAEDLPEMDPVSGSCDPFVSVKFNGNVQRTNIVRRDTKPVWLQHIWLPVYTPCMSDNIDIQLWDWNRANPDELIATHRVTFSSLLSSSFGPAWVNLYGACRPPLPPP